MKKLPEPRVKVVLEVELETKSVLVVLVLEAVVLGVVVLVLVVLVVLVLGVVVLVLVVLVIQSDAFLILPQERNFVSLINFENIIVNFLSNKIFFTRIQIHYIYQFILSQANIVKS